jgi:hypothetical protein
MKRFLSMTSAIAVSLSSLWMVERAQSRGVMATERPWAPEHVEGLPPDIRRDVEEHARTCGNRPAAGHYFSVSIEGSGLRFWAQHFEDFACERRASVCRPEGCLHEIFADDGRRQRHVFSIYARDIKLTNEGGIAGLEVFDHAGVRCSFGTAGASSPRQSRERSANLRRSGHRPSAFRRLENRLRQVLGLWAAEV